MNKYKDIEQERHHEKITTFFMRLVYSLTTVSLSFVILLTYYLDINNKNLIIFHTLVSFTSIYFVFQQSNGIFVKFSFDKVWYKNNPISRIFLNNEELDILLKQALEDEDYLFAHKINKRKIKNNDLT